MLRPELYNRTVDILVAAYFNDTLEHNNCYACAVGNIIAANCGYKHIKVSSMFHMKAFVGQGTLCWDTNNNFVDNPVSITHPGKTLDNRDVSDLFMKHVASTGYTFKELSEIEAAFETASHFGDKMFNGLMAVIEALDIIHENNDTQVTTNSKNKFNKQLQTV